MTKYREIFRLSSQGFSERNIALSCSVSRNTVSKVLKAASEKDISWPLDESKTDKVLETVLFPKDSFKDKSDRPMPDFAYIRKELLRNGVSKKLLWTEYCEMCHMDGKEPLMYSQFCYYIQQDEQKRRATMHIPRKPGEQVEVDWAGDPAHIIDPDIGVITEAWIFVGAFSYSQYAYAEAFLNEKQKAWITAALRNEQFFSLSELNQAIRKKLEAYNARDFQKKEGSRLEMCEWKEATVQFNYHIAVDKMYYSVPHQYIKDKVDVRITDTTIEVFS